MSSNKITMGAFRTISQARSAVFDLEIAGVTPTNISIVMHDSDKENFARLDKNTKAPEGAATGGAAGMAVGALAAGLTAVAGIAIPGVGLFAAGPLVAALAGAGAGGAAGGAVGGLLGLGITEHEAKFHTSVLKEGGAIVAVSTDDKDELKKAQDVLNKLSVKSETAKGKAAYV